MCLLLVFDKPFFLNLREMVNSLNKAFVKCIEPVDDLVSKFLATTESLFVDFLCI